jgi:hypothetical protein
VGVMATFLTKRRSWALSTLLLLAIAAGAMIVGSRSRPTPDTPIVVVQNFERGWFAPRKWPRDGRGSVAFTKEWAADGVRSLRIDGGLMAAITDLHATDWSRHDALRLSFLNPSARTATVGIEIQDRHIDFHERYQDELGIAPGEQIVELDLTGGLWRGEQNRPYRGKVKTPIELETITRLSLVNRSDGPLYVDRIELVRVPPIETEGGFAFDFGPATARVMRHTVGVNESTHYAEALGFGLLGPTTALKRSMSFPTALLGDGLAIPDEGFGVDLPGGHYRGLVAFERGGFWEGEAAGYEHAALVINGASVHVHSFARHGAHFAFEDLEITAGDRLVDELLWPAHALARFDFEAQRGHNVVRLEVTGESGLPLRVAGLVLAPDTPAGDAFLAAHEEEQRRAIATTFVLQDRRRRDGRAPPGAALVAEPMWVGEPMHPGDWPQKPSGAPLPELIAPRGHVLAVQLAFFATTPVTVLATATPLSSPEGATIPSPRLSHGRYLPQRSFGVGPIWLEVNHYRPEPEFSLGPELARPLLVEYAIPAAAPPGDYEGHIIAVSEVGRLELPLRVRVVAVALAPLPIPVCLLHNALPFRPEALGEERWWELQDELLAEQAGAGLGCVTGGPGLLYDYDKTGDGYEFRGERPLRYLRRAVAHGMARAVFPYGGFFARMRGLADPQAFARDFIAFERREALPPHYIYTYDEPRTDEELAAVLEVIEPLTAAGLRTMGYTSVQADSAWQRLVAASHAVALHEHDAGALARLSKAGQRPLVYNNGLDRAAMGLHLWRGIKLGAEARLEWIGMLTQGFAFHNLDGREPFVGAWLVHSRLGVMPTPRWLTAREGLLDARVRLALEAMARPGDPALASWSLDGYGRDHLDEEALAHARAAMLTAGARLSAPARP